MSLLFLLQQIFLSTNALERDNFYDITRNDHNYLKNLLQFNKQGDKACQTGNPILPNCTAGTFAVTRKVKAVATLLVLISIFTLEIFHVITNHVYDDPTFAGGWEDVPWTKLRPNISPIDRFTNFRSCSA
ncbi:hypothetical protein TNIN_405681 [Trichonephila inaurata madagascariensis]|uniref:Uncharacterized protein n=1 Tax=Trichonephila inaurata madagascariensis TaxID=2747483 RepID=A0A8X6IAK1_9ARAC|nr:hypothetical protein TNIN_405681 [Trichonephila inaurata madagascariensis]